MGLMAGVGADAIIVDVPARSRKETRMSRISVSLSLLLALGVAVPALAQNATGVITESSRPIVGAAVLVDGTETVFTDQEGRFTAPLEAGDRKLKVALSGYLPIERTVTAEVDKDVIADFALEPVLQIQAVTVPATLAQGAAGKAQFAIKNNGTSTYAVQQAGLWIEDAAGVQQTANFTFAADTANPTEIKAGETATFSFDLTPTAAAAAGKLTVRASLFAFDTALGANLLPNGSFESVSEDGAPDEWAFGIDNEALGIEATGTIVTSTSVTGQRSAEVRVPVSPEGDVRAYWSNPEAIEAGKSYVLSGYIRTENVESAAGFGASVYVPVTGNDPYQQPNSPWMTGTKGWRKAIIAFSTTADGGDSPTAHSRGEMQQATGVAWFDNMSLTEGTVDGSLTVTGGDSALEVTKP
jgi:hypothetical protein